MEKYFEVLKKCPLFYKIESDSLIAMLKCLDAKIKKFCKNETIISEGEEANDVGVILSGGAQIVRVDYYGNRSIISSVEPSELFCKSFACADIKSIPVSVIATKKSEIMLINSQRIMHSCGNACDFHQQIIYNLMKNLAKKNLLFHQKIEITSKRSTREKLLTYLALQAKKSGSSCFEIHFDRQELADYLEVERSGLSAEISKLRKEAIIINRKNYFELL